MSFSGLVKFLIGFFLAISLLLVAGGATAYYFLTKLSTPPAKPMYANDKSVLKAKAAASASKKPTPASSAPASPTPTASTPLEPGAYIASVTWPEGLSLRENPSLEASRVGGVGFNQRVVVIKESDDKRWQQVRLENGEQQGWIKAGNVKRVDSE
ncbi:MULTISPECIES: SH3 domain-containing protein [Cyanophyceae]|uniref:SH3 domain-containing protein n=1 Tax=Cyanophyceae TaxID=3028117 RepID=UPI001688D5F8|nr:SH3 domain-containing protein [Trichocoleus sp. FACHB-40]MBD2006566.1 SH3 domain-containing protein [Trichocoleus sp. FACHB-40]